jgi:hypothetical protein
MSYVQTTAKTPGGLYAYGNTFAGICIVGIVLLILFVDVIIPLYCLSRFLPQAKKETVPKEIQDEEFDNW